MGIIAMKPLGGGLLERADLCFRFLQQYPYVVPIPDISIQEEVNEIINLYLSPKPLSEADHKQIERLRSELGKNSVIVVDIAYPVNKKLIFPEF